MSVNKEFEETAKNDKNYWKQFGAESYEDFNKRGKITNLNKDTTPLAYIESISNFISEIENLNRDQRINLAINRNLITQQQLDNMGFNKSEALFSTEHGIQALREEQNDEKRPGFN